jgi:hypothetical protein
MEGDGFADIGRTSPPEHLHDEHETQISLRSDGLTSPVEVALSKYADSIEGLSAGWSPEADPYTRGFVAGLRAAIKVAANVNQGSDKPT